MKFSTDCKARLEAMEAILDALPDIVCFKDGEGRWIKANRADIELFELNGVDYVGKKDSELAKYSPFYREAFLTCEKTDEAAWRRGEVSRGLEWIPKSDGTTAIFDVYKIPLFNDDGSRRGLVVFGRDVTELVEGREELKTQNRLFSEAERLAGLGHWQWWVPEDRLELSEGIFTLFREEGVEQVFPSTMSQYLEKVHPEDREGFHQAFKRFLSSREERFEYEHRIVLSSGRVRMVRHVAVAERNVDGRPLVLRGVTQDITRFRELSYKVTLAELVFQHCIEGIVVTDAQGTILDVNPAFTEITGYTREEAIGQNPRILKSDRHDEAFYREMWERILKEGIWKGEIWNRRKSGEVYPEILTIKAVKDLSGQVVNYLSIFHDLTSERKKEEESRFYRYYDPLTGLMNRDSLLERLRHLSGKVDRRRRSVALILLDLDDFRQLNEVLSYRTGDAILQRLATMLLEVGSPDEVARLGEDCFALIVDSARTKGRLDPVGWAERLSGMVSRISLEEQELEVTCSMGISLMPHDTTDAEELVRYAELALRRAKEQGRGHYRFFDREMFIRQRRRLDLERSIRAALGKGEFVPFYQPKVSLATGRVEGFEALARWRREDGSLVSPGEFIPLAEETGLIVPITRELLQRVVEDLVAMRERAPHIHVAVNFSQHCFRQPDFVERVVGMVEFYGLPPSSFQVEITETMAMADEEWVRKILEEFHDHGIKSGMDDFGTGYSSLYYLKNLPIDLLKIDRSFIMDLEGSESSRRLVRAIIAMGEALGIEVCAEGVETVEQLEFLARNGCSLIQGYLFSRPVPLEEAVELLDQSLWERCRGCTIVRGGGGEEG